MTEATRPSRHRTLTHIAGVLAAILAMPGPARSEDAVRQVLPGGPTAVAAQNLTREAPRPEAEEPALPLPNPESGVPATTGTITPQSDESEVQRFCSNIADAARDRRYSLQAAELKELQTEVDKRIAALEQKRAEYEEWLKRREVFLARAEDSLVKIYSGMKPDAAAEQLAGINAELAAAILMKLEARKASVILNEMDTKAAAALTGIMGSAARRVDPT
ncbi:MotE family protein [Mesorhizobium retamae]|uniref:MotE family protein n=1 Tax=Mesorhizobium retamae TaxID=2912854 RepID=A0ABS9QCP7_9HYPH|nr:MotE family protein [Mesorhizobium sp. IRAMC:0171]